jgi:hypothetical protein
VTWQPDPDRVLLGLAATRGKWPHGEYAFVLPPCALPLYYGHEVHLFASHGPADASNGTELWPEATARSEAGDNR